MGTFWLVAYILITLWTIVIIIFYGSRPTKSLAWVLATIALPFFGAFFYYLFGVNRKKFKFFRLRTSLRNQLQDTEEGELLDKSEFDFKSFKEEKLSRLITNNSFLFPYPDNHIEILDDGEETFEAIFSAMAEAKKFIHIQYYILEQGELFERLCKLFEELISKGVEVRIIYDSFGSYHMRMGPKEKLEKMGVKIFPILPIRFGNLLFSLNYRNHRKIVVIDGHIGFTGGVNLSDKYIKKVSPIGKWGDLHLQLKGPIVDSLHRVFIKDFHFASQGENLLNKDYLPQSQKQGNTVAQIVSGGPDSPHASIMQQYIAMLHAAEKCITIANPYFIPGIAFLESLKLVALSGIKIDIIVPKKTDSLMAKYSMFSQFEELLKVGINIYLRDQFSHSKVLIIDNEIVSIGSGNFDYRSFEHNYETNVLMYDKKLAEEVDGLYDEFRKPRKKIDYEAFKTRPKWQRFCEGLAKFMSPLL